MLQIAQNTNNLSKHSALSHEGKSNPKSCYPRGAQGNGETDAVFTPALDQEGARKTHLCFSLSVCR